MVIDVLIKKAPQLLVRFVTGVAVANERGRMPPHFVGAPDTGVRNGGGTGRDNVADLGVDDRADDQLGQLGAADLGITYADGFVALPPDADLLQLGGLQEPR